MNHEMKRFTDGLKLTLLDQAAGNVDALQAVEAMREMVGEFCESREDIDPDRYEIIETALGACNTLLRTVGIDFYAVMAAMVSGENYKPVGVAERREAKERYFELMRQAERCGR